MLLLYNLFVIFVKVCLQIMSCVYIKQILSANCCWLLQLLGVVCLQTNFKLGENCTVLTSLLPVGLEYGKGKAMFVALSDVDRGWQALVVRVRMS